MKTKIVIAIVIGSIFLLLAIKLKSPQLPNKTLNYSQPKNETFGQFGDFYAQQKNNGVYVNDVLVPTPTPQNFGMKAGATGPKAQWFGHDLTTVYCGNNKTAKSMPDADVKSFAIIDMQFGNNTFTKDNERVYLNCEPLEDADPNSFEIYGSMTEGYQIFDTNKVWFSDDATLNAPSLKS